MQKAVHLTWGCLFFTTAQLFYITTLGIHLLDLVSHSLKHALATLQTLILTWSSMSNAMMFLCRSPSTELNAFT